MQPTSPAPAASYGVSPVSVSRSDSTAELPIAVVLPLIRIGICSNRFPDNNV
jgi:hypothetical protein